MSAPINILSPYDPARFAALGVEFLVYVRPVEDQGRAAYGIYGADGTQLAVMASRDIAFAASIQQDMKALSVH